MRKLVFIHTTPVLLGRINRELKEKLVDISIENIMDDTLSKLLKIDRNKALKRLDALIRVAEEGSVSKDVEVVITCTALSDLSKETYRETSMIDSYLHKESRKYKDILLVATNKSALSPHKKNILANNKDKAIDEIHIKDALKHFKRGNKELHNEMIKKEVMEKIENKNYEAIILCQPSLSHLKDQLEILTNIKVLTGVDYFIEKYSWNNK